jgi:hypothetical protein
MKVKDAMHNGVDWAGRVAGFGMASARNWHCQNLPTSETSLSIRPVRTKWYRAFAFENWNFMP